MATEHVLGAIVIVMLMASAVAFVATYEPPRPSAAQAVERQMEQNALDFLYVYKDWSMTEPCNGKTMLERFILDGINGDHTEWDRRISKFFPLGTDTSLLLDNGEGLYPLHERYEIQGATRDLAIQPDWSFVLPLESVSTSDGVSRAAVDFPAVFYSDLVTPDGEAVRMSVSYVGLGGTYQSTAWGISALQELDVGSDRLEVVWAKQSGEPETVLKATLRDLDPQLESKTFYLEVGAVDLLIPENLTLGFHLPPGWTFTGEARGPEGWETPGLDAWNPGHQLQFRRDGNASAPGPHILSFKAKPPASPVQPFDVITAQLSNGSLAQSSLVVTYPISAERSLPRAAYVTMPYPVRLNSTALFGVTFANGGPNVTVTQVDLEVPGGYDIRRNDGQGAELFAPFDEPLLGVEQLFDERERGAWTWLDAKHLRWSGSRNVSAGGAAEWLVELPITADESEVTSVEGDVGAGPEAEVAFAESGFSVRGTGWGASPGVVRLRVPADDVSTLEADGYPASAGEHAYAARLRSGGLRLEAEESLTVQPVEGSDEVNLEHALANSSFVVERRLVPLGGMLSAAFRGESLVTDVAAAGGAVARLAVKLYAPPSLGCAPTAVWERDGESMPLAAVHDVVPVHLNGMDGVVLVADDRNAYRLDARGDPLWSRKLDGAGLVVEPAAFGALDERLYVGTSLGSLYRLDPLTGEVRAQVRVEPASAAHASLPHEVTLVEVDAARGLLLVGTSQGVVEVRDAWTLDVLHRAVPSAGVAVRQARFLSDGGVMVLHAEGLARYDAALEPQAAAPLVDPVGFAMPNDALVLLAQGRETRLIDAATLTAVAADSLPHEQRVALSVAGDATGDGVEDLVVALDDARLDVVDGALLLRREWKPPELLDVDAPFVMDAFSPSRKLDHVSTITGVSDDLARECKVETYQTVTFECLPAEPGDLGLGEHGEPADQALPHPLALDVAAGRVAYSAWDGHASVVRVFDENRVELRESRSTPGVRVESARMGAWLLEEKLATGANDGLVRVSARDAPVETFHASPTEFVGRFTFNMAVPEGGFYGAHLLVAELAWNTAEGEERHARLLDWFVVGDKEGKAVAKPAYRLVMVVDKPDER